MCHRAEALLGRANSASPVVDWGLTSLYHLTATEHSTTADPVRVRAAWRAELRRYDTDPSGWLRRYYRDLVRDFTGRHGPGKGAAFAAKLARNGHLSAADAADAVSE